MVWIQGSALRQPILCKLVAAPYPIWIVYISGPCSANVSPSSFSRSDALAMFLHGDYETGALIWSSIYLKRPSQWAFARLRGAARLSARPCRPFLKQPPVQRPCAHIPHEILQIGTAAALLTLSSTSILFSSLWALDAAHTKSTCEQ